MITDDTAPGPQEKTALSIRDNERFNDAFGHYMHWYPAAENYVQFRIIDGRKPESHRRYRYHVPHYCLEVTQDFGKQYLPYLSARCGRFKKTKNVFLDAPEDALAEAFFHETASRFRAAAEIFWKIAIDPDSKPKVAVEASGPNISLEEKYNSISPSRMSRPLDQSTVALIQRGLLLFASKRAELNLPLLLPSQTPEEMRAQCAAHRPTFYNFHHFVDGIGELHDPSKDLWTRRFHAEAEPNPPGRDQTGRPSLRQRWREAGSATLFIAELLDRRR